MEEKNLLKDSALPNNVTSDILDKIIMELEEAVLQIKQCKSQNLVKLKIME